MKAWQETWTDGCPARAKYDVMSHHPYREWMACECHALECEREGCEVERAEVLP